MDASLLKKAAAEQAAQFVEDGMMLGLGTGSTVFFLVEAIAKRVKEEHLHITGVATSSRTAQQATELGIKMIDINDAPTLDLTIDGADEIDANFQGIKGGGAAHLLEKIVALNSKRNVWIVDQSKLVQNLGAFPLPLEVIPFGSNKLFQRLAAENLQPEYRLNANGERMRTHNKNFVIDLHIGVIEHPHLLGDWLDHQTGIVEHGLFLDVVSQVVVGKETGVEILQAPR
ncbi:ribose-5-phosphate isomerase RpiA [Lapidilactobacillus mulanensis]|uniref:Ribose-5-phosphate isomerase A n=1 Tax=Lapidilactobacillus mulanensis TaxID=2485999 RepID=A0ABW4DL30_9LACO|nr:ribose-5-phosphate isomerase RpiA [Lapidilactobacillus mulanensis]